jgi:signal transduction histidine kinase
MKNAVMRILVVDDDEDDFVILKDMLSEIRQWNVDAQWASSYEQALGAVGSGLYDLCLMDYRLGRNTGVSLMHEFQQKGFSAPVIVLTGHGDHEVDLKAMEEGAADYLEKGRIDHQILERSIRYAIERARNLETLRQSEQQLRILSSKLLKAQENERKRLAHELHDSIGASLTAVKLGLERELSRARSGGEAEETLLEGLVSNVEITIKDLKRIYGNLRPLILDDLGVLAALRTLVRQFGKMRPHVRFNQQITAPEDDIPEPLKIVIYRISQEALNNISKHSDATEVTLSLVNNGKTLALLIRDNGKGFDMGQLLEKKRKDPSLGLESMQERVELSGGSFTINSNKSTGTTIKAIWSLSGQ